MSRANLSDDEQEKIDHGNNRNGRLASSRGRRIFPVKRTATVLDPACKNRRHAETNAILSGHYDDEPEMQNFRDLVHKVTSTFMELNNLNFCGVIVYDKAFAQVFARCFAQHSLQVATNKFGKPAKDAAFKKMR